MIDLFQPEDFYIKPQGDVFRWSYWDSERHEMAKIANTKLKAYIQCLDKLYGDARLGSYHGKPLLWSIDEKPESTHSIRIIDLQKINKDSGS